MKRILFWLGAVWSSPTTLLGFLLAAFGGAVPVRTFRGCWVWHAWAGPLAFFFDRHFSEAFTLGQIVIVKEEAYAFHMPLLTHEAEHTRQALLLGPLFLPAYFAASLVSRLRGTGWYRGNWFEVAARAHEEKTIRWEADKR